MKKSVVLWVLFCVSLGVVSLAVAQGPRAQPVEPHKAGYWSNSDIHAAITHLKAGEKVDFPRLDRGNHNFNLNFRDKSGAPEMHANWTDIYYVLDGEATWVHGGKLEGAEERRPGEFGGGKIVGGTQQKVAPGDIASSPAGMPHQFLVPEGKTFAYFTVKVARQDMPEPSGN